MPSFLGNSSADNFVTKLILRLRIQQEQKQTPPYTTLTSAAPPINFRRK